MAFQSINNKELEVSFFAFAYITKDGLTTVEVNEVDMSGWTILECHLPQQHDVVYFDWNAETGKLTLLDLDHQDVANDYTYLMEKLLETKRKKAA